MGVMDAITKQMHEAIDAAERDDRPADVGPIYQEGGEVVGVRIDGQWIGKEPNRMPTPLTEAGLAAIRERGQRAHREFVRWSDDISNSEPSAEYVTLLDRVLGTDGLTLLAEVERLRAALQDIADTLDCERCAHKIKWARQALGLEPPT